jgi:hypothetical protein
MKTALIAILSAGLGFAAATIMFLAFQQRDQGTQTAGARIQAECASVVDTAGTRVAGIAVLEVVELDEATKTDLNKRFKSYSIPDKIDYLKEHEPAKWNAGVAEAHRRERESMIRACVLKRGFRAD